MTYEDYHLLLHTAETISNAGLFILGLLAFIRSR